MFVLMRAATYSALFIGLLLVFLPARVLQESGITRPSDIGFPQVAGTLVAAAGAALALGCIWAFVIIGKGTPAPFDPPRRLVIRGPYGFVRHPMYIGAVLALLGAALFYGSAALAAYAGIFLLVVHVFVISYEEPTLQKTFGSEYGAYRNRVRRWWPRLARKTKATTSPL